MGLLKKFHPHTFCTFFGKIKIFANLLYVRLCRFSTLSIFLKNRYKICKERLSQQPHNLKSLQGGYDGFTDRWIRITRSSR